MKRTLLTFVALTMTAAFAQSQLANAQLRPSSGMLLGVYAFENYRGLRVTGTIPGYSAQGRIYPNDVLLRVTADGVKLYPTRTHWQFEQAKDQIGPFQPASLEIFRPGVGYTYLWVEFQPVGGGPAARAQVQSLRSRKQMTPQAVRKMGVMKAKILTEREKPGAAQLFKKKTSKPAAPRTNPPRRQNPSQDRDRLRPEPRPNTDVKDPRSLFRHR